MTSFRILGLVFAQGINATINFLFLPYLVRTLSKTEYGMYGQTLLVGDTVRALFAMGLTTVLYVHISSSDRKSDVFKSNLALASALGFFGGLATFLSADFFSSLFETPGLAPLIRIYSLQIVFFIPFSVINALLIFLGKIQESVFTFTVTLLLRVFLIVLAVEFFASLAYLFWGLVLVGIVQIALAWKMVPRAFRDSGRWHKTMAKDQFSQGIRLGLTELLGFGILYTDKFMVSSILSTNDFAVFRNGSIEIPIVGTLYTSVAAVMLPKISKLFAEGQYAEIVRLKRKVITVTIACIYPLVLFLIIYARPLVTLYLSELYAASAGVFAILCLGLLLRVNDYMDLLVSARRERLMMGCYFGAFLFNLLLNPILIHKFGYLGAAASTVLTLTILLSSLFVLSAREVKAHWLAFLDLPKITATIFISCGLPLAARALFPEPRFPTIALSALLCLSLSYLSFFKLGIIAYEDVAPLVRKLPWVGNKLDERLSYMLSSSIDYGTRQ